MYPGDSSVFHCGFRGIIENREKDTNECFYDSQGDLVDEAHEWSGCRGTPDEWAATSFMGRVKHSLFDAGGLCNIDGVDLPSVKNVGVLGVARQLVQATRKTCAVAYE